MRPPDATPTLFNHDMMGSYADVHRVEGLHLNGCRALARTRPGDVIQLHPDLAQEFGPAVEHYRRIGIDCTENAVWDPGPGVVRDYPDHHYSVFLFGPEHHRFRPDLARLTATAHANSKNEFMAWCLDRGFPVPATTVHRQGDAPPAVRPRSLPVFVKGDVSGCGLQVFRCETAEQVRAAVDTIAGPYQVQEALDALEFLNVQYETGPDGTVEHLLTTEQVMNGFRHIGNRCPSRYDPRAVTDPVAAGLAACGLSGVFAFDVAVVREGGGVAYRVIEANPRHNGATYYTWAAQRLGITRWTGLDLPTRYRSLSELLRSDALRELAYDPGRGTGIVLVNWGTVLAGSLGVMCAGHEDEQAAMRERLREAL